MHRFSTSLPGRCSSRVCQSALLPLARYDVVPCLNRCSAGCYAPHALGNQRWPPSWGLPLRPCITRWVTSDGLPRGVCPCGRAFACISPAIPDAAASQPGTLYSSADEWARRRTTWGRGSRCAVWPPSAHGMRIQWLLTLDWKVAQGRRSRPRRDRDSESPRHCRAAAPRSRSPCRTQGS